MKKASLFLLIFGSPFFLFSSLRISAQDSTPSAKEEELNTQIEQIKNAVREQVEEKLKSITAEQKKVSWVGTIKEKDNSTIALENSQGERQALYDEETVVVNLSSQEQDFQDLTEGKKVAILGYEQTPNLINAKRIILVKENNLQKFPSVGIISDKSQVENLLVITPLINKDQSLEILTNSQSKVMDSEGKIISYKELEKEQKVALVYQTDDKGSTALLIRVLQ
ncbi:MAG: hypothetical protein ABIB61_01505 [Candidatus Shapirobacteria bacterium]